MWQLDKKQFLQMAKNTTYQLFVYQFEREEAEARRRPNIKPYGQ
jgi:hypothetical protein